MDDLLNDVPMPAGVIPEYQRVQLKQMHCPTGANIAYEDNSVEPSVQPLLGTDAIALIKLRLPSTINLALNMPLPKHQGNFRSTCVAFATLAAYEHLLTKEEQYVDLSEQYLYWLCKKNDADPNGQGTEVQVAFEMLQRVGCCSEVLWPYVPDLIANNESHDPPPREAHEAAPSFLVTEYKRLPPMSVDAIKVELALGHCVVISIPVYASWHNNDLVKVTGDIPMFPPNETRMSSGHAICVVGYEDVANDPFIRGGGKFLVRNSWKDWGRESWGGEGYGTLMYEYITIRGKEAFSLTSYCGQKEEA